MLDDHTGAKLRGFNAAHRFYEAENGRNSLNELNTIRKFQTTARRNGAWNNLPVESKDEVRREKALLAQKISINVPRGSIKAPVIGDTGEKPRNPLRLYKKNSKPSDVFPFTPSHFSLRGI
jgi:hypothetical protein